MAGTEALRSWTRGYSPVTDDHPAVEYFLFNADKPFDPEALLAMAQPPVLAGTETWDAARLCTRAGGEPRGAGVHALKRAGEWEAAKARVEEARAEVGDNAFLPSSRTWELDCLRPAR